MKYLTSAFVIAGLFATGTAMARSGDVYTFGNYTYSNLNGATSLASDADNRASQSNNTFGLGAGYVINDHFALELGYKDLGTLKFDYKHVGYDNRDNLLYLNQGHGSLTSKAIVLRGIGLLPLANDVTLEGSVGVGVRRATLQDAYTDQTFYSGNEVSRAASIDRQHTSLIPLVGVGASYAFNPRLSLFGRYEFAYKAVDLNQLNTKDMPSLHASTFDLGLRYTL